MTASIAPGATVGAEETSSVRWHAVPLTWTHQNHSTRAPGFNFPPPNGPDGSAAPVVPALRPTL